MKKYIFFIMALFLGGGVKQPVYAAAAAEDSETLNKRESELGKLLISAVCNNKIEEVKKLLAEGAPVNYETDDDGYTPIMLAVIDDRDEIIRLLINAGADVNRVDKSGWLNPLVSAIREDRSDIVSMLLDAGAVMDMPKNPYYRTVLLLAAEQGRSEIARLLVLAGANPDIANDKGMTAYTISGSLAYGVTREQMTETIRQAVEERCQRGVIVEGFLPIPGVANLVTEDYLSALTLVSAQALSDDEEDERKEENEEKEDGKEKEDGAGALAESRAQARARRASSEDERGSFYADALGVALRMEARAEERRAGEAPQPDKDGFYD